jgi:iron complex outermembrane receptor protein
MKYGILADRLRRSAALGALLTATGTMAWAQQAPPTPPPQVIQTTPPAEEPDATADRITVTGSRIQTDTYSSSSAMTVVTADEAGQQGVADIATLLQNSVAAAGSTQTTSAISAALAAPPGGLGTQTLSLRGLGANRTLVLLNGRRAGPAGTGGSVGPFDLNVIPLSAVERVEVLKDGASSLYGSDAIAGVVNIITKTDSSSSIDFSHTSPMLGAGDELSISGTWGHDFGQGYIRVSAEYYKQEEFDRGDNDWFQCGERYIFKPDGSRADLVDPTTGKYTCTDDVIWGHNWTYDYGDNVDDADGYFHRPWQDNVGLYQYDYTGRLGNYLPAFNSSFRPTSGLINPPGWYPVGYGQVLSPGFIPDPLWAPYAKTSEGAISYFHPFQNDATLAPEIERMTAIASGEFDVNDSLTLYGEALFNRRTTREDGFSQVYTYQYIAFEDGVGLFGDPAAFDAGWSLYQDTTDYKYVALSPTAITDHADQTVQVDYFRAVGGAKGDMPFLSNWNYDVSAQFSRSEGIYKEDIFWLDALRPYYNKTDYCAAVEPVTPYRGVPCVDVDWYSPRFNNGELTAQEKAFLYGNTKSSTTYQQATIEGYMTGPLFALPAGDLNAVVGFQAQRDTINDEPAQPWLDGEVWSGGRVRRGITKGSDVTTAAYVEFGVPIVKDLPFAKDVNLSLSGRYTDVDSYGTGETYKVGLNWAVTDSIRFRASQGTSFRAPGLFELFLSEQLSSFALSGDPCAGWGAKLADKQISQTVADNCANDPKVPGGIGPSQLSQSGIQATVFTSGGIGTLKAETSEAKSLGVVWQPDFADFQLSIDYYDIEVNDQVSKLLNSEILTGCYGSPNFPAEPLCDLFTRKPLTDAGGTALPAGGSLLTITNNYINLNSQIARGIDIEARYGLETGIGDFDFSLKASHALESTLKTLPGSPPEDDVGWAGEPPWVANLNTTYERGPFTVFYGIRYVDATSQSRDFLKDNPELPYTQFGEEIIYKFGTPPIFYHNLSLGIDVEELGLTTQIGVRNMFDQDPPNVSQGVGFLRVGNKAIESQYDLYGRTFFVNVSKKF